MPGVEIKKVKAEDDGMRLNRWFMKYYPNLTLGRLQKLLRTKQIKVDGKRAETSLKLAAGSEVRVPPMDEQPETGANRSEISRRDAEFILSLVIYKDDNIIVLNKPSGLAVQGGTNTSRHVDGMLEALRFELNEKPKLVHRIDKDTSGVLVLARNRTWADRLTKAFREHALPKTYLALVNSCPKNPAGEIKAPLEKCGEKSLVSPDGKPAATVYKTLDEVGSKFALVEASPLTGRTHQIRAHMEYIGCPIVGDDKYFGGEKRQKYASIPDKLYLHAYKIDLSALYNKKTVIKAALPEHFKKALAALGIEFKG
jgi:23S rRNA pseudouridine955/2504/2580 synthase